MKNILHMGYALIFSLVLVSGAALHADSPCKGLGESECKSNDKCTWVSGYTQKDGDKVKAYCRAKPGQANADKSDKKSKRKDKSEDVVKADDDKAEKKESKKAKKKKDKEDKAEAKDNKAADSKADKKDKKEKKKKKKTKKDE